MTAKNNFIKILKNGGVILLGLIILFGLFYKGYNYYHKNNVKASKVISADKKKMTKSNSGQGSSVDKNRDKNVRHNVSKDGMKYTYDAQKVRDILENKAPNDGKKIAFLTFDDGPSTTVTPIVLNVLRSYNVKATFFLLGKNVEKNEKSKCLVKQIFTEGNAIGNHTYTHSLRRLYPGNRIDVNTVMAEIEQDNTAIRDIVGQDFNTRALRLPGGYMSRVYYHDPNLGEFNAKLKEKDIYSIDWNAYDFDAEGRRKNAEQLLEHVERDVGKQQKVVILMHDTYGKEETAKALPQIIEYLKSQGYEFKTIA